MLLPVNVNAMESCCLWFCCRLYSCQSILVHELGHALHNLAMDTHQRLAVCDAYAAARTAGAYPSTCYMLTNEQEYWACGEWLQMQMHYRRVASVAAAVGL